MSTTDLTSPEPVAPLVLNGNSAQDRDLLMSLRKSYLEAVDALERRLGITPRTAEIRQLARAEKLSRKCEERTNGTNGHRTDN